MSIHKGVSVRERNRNESWGGADLADEGIMTISAQVATGGGGRSGGAALAGDAKGTQRPPVIPSRTSGECE